MGRSSKKGPFVDPRLYEKVEKQLSGGDRDPIKTWSRACTIVPEFIGLTFMVHNGKQHLKVLVACQSLTSSLEEASSDAAWRARSAQLSATCRWAQNSRRRLGGVGAER